MKPIFSVGVNRIVPNSAYSTIAGGCNNYLADEYGAIGGGCNNTINPGSCGSLIAGGGQNRLSGAYSAILGGQNNTLSHNCAGLFGNGLVSCSDDTFHVSCLNAVNTPLIGGFIAPGTLYKIPITPAMTAIGFPATGFVVLI